MKKFICIFLIVFIIISSPIQARQKFCFAEQNTKIEYETEIDKNINDQLNSLNLSPLDEILNQIVDDQSIFSGTSFKDKLKQIISGDLSLNTTDFLSYIYTIFIEDMVSFLPYACLIIAIAVLYSMVNASKPTQNKSIGDVIHFVCYGAIVVIIVVWISKLLSMTSDTLINIKTQMELIFPILLTVLTALGGNVSVGIYQPAMAILSGSIISLFVNILLPIFIFKLVFTIISNLTTNIKFGKFSDFFGSAFKWLMGIVLTLFSAFVSIQGLMAGSIDTISLRTTKYTIKSAIPMIGGFLSDSVSLILISSNLIKNAVGVGGLVLLFCTMLVPLIKIIVFSFLMKLASAILEPIADSRVTNFVNSIGKSIQLLTALILGVAFMYFIIISLIMCSTNIF